MKAAINPITISIQFWKSKPKKVNRSMRKCTGPAPFLSRISASPEKIYYFYISRRLEGKLGMLRSVSRAERGAMQQQFVELRGVEADTVGPGDEDLPALFGESSSFGDGGDTLNRTVVVLSSSLDACTMKVTATPFCAMRDVTL
jgi:hypothetical protein